MPLDEKLRQHFEFIQSHTDYFITLYNNGLQQISSAKFSVFLPDTIPIWSENPVEQAYRSQYIIAGIEAVQRV